MEKKINGKYYKFIPSNVVSFDNIKTNNKKIDNDIYEKYDAKTEISGELIICNDMTKVIHRGIDFIDETYSEYINDLEKRDPKKDIWIYNIINGISEQEYILYRDDKCIVIPTYNWNVKDIDKLHILCLPIDTSLRTIRSLDETHIPLLEHMKKVTLQIIKDNFGLKECSIKKYFHYPPSSYHLHIHFVNNLVKYGSSIEYSHDLNSVIFNLSICSDYYKKIVLNKIK
jgi:hypothetical protein